MLGRYPRLVTDARITSRMVRWRGVRVDSVDREGRSESASRVSLSLIRPNVAAFRQDIKHVFEVCRVSLVQRSSKAVGARFYRLRRVQQFDHMFGIRTHYRLCFEQVIEQKPTGGTKMIPPSAPIRVRPIQVRPPARRGGHRGPQPCRPVAAPPRYRGTGVLMSTASHRPRPITPATTVALALVAAGITVWLGFVAHFGGMLYAGPEKAAVQMPDRLAVVRVEPGGTLERLAARVAPDAPSGQVAARIRELNELDSSAVTAGQTLIAPVG